MEKNVVRYYVLCNKLKKVIRTGWLDWNIKSDRIESVAEHIYSTLMLAISMYSEFNYKLDLSKVLYMLAVHELEEIFIGDLTMFQIDREEKKKMGHEAVSKILSGLKKKDEIMNLVLEFDERETEEAKFAYLCDKLDADILARIYDLENPVDLNNQDNNDTYKDSRVQELLSEDNSFSRMWLLFGQKTYPYDENFLRVSNYALNNNILEVEDED